MKNQCEYSPYGKVCTAPDTNCEHWQGTFCDIDIEKGKVNDKRTVPNIPALE